MPHTLELLSRGEISGWTVRLITEQISHLDRATRTGRRCRPRRPPTRARWAPQEAAATAKRLAYQADPRSRDGPRPESTSDRRVTLRPAPDTMSLLTGLLPVEQGVACLAALQAEATAAEGRR